MMFAVRADVLLPCRHQRKGGRCILRCLECAYVNCNFVFIFAVRNWIRVDCGACAVAAVGDSFELASHHSTFCAVAWLAGWLYS